MRAMESQITSLTIVYSTVYSGADQRKHQNSASLALVRGNSLVTDEFPAQMASNAESVSIWWRHHRKCIQYHNIWTVLYWHPTVIRRNLLMIKHFINMPPICSLLAKSVVNDEEGEGWVRNYFKKDDFLIEFSGTYCRGGLILITDVWRGVWYALQKLWGILIYWGRDKTAAIFQMTFSKVFSCMKICDVCLRFHWSLFLWFYWKIFQHRFR